MVWMVHGWGRGVGSSGCTFWWVWNPGKALGLLGSLIVYWLKCVQNVPCLDLENSDIISFDSQLGGPCLHIGNPVGVLVCCEDQVFLVIPQVNQLHFASKYDLQELEFHLLADGGAKVGFQILRLVQAITVDDPKQQYNWCWSFGMDGCVPG